MLNSIKSIGYGSNIHTQQLKFPHNQSINFGGVKTVNDMVNDNSLSTATKLIIGLGVIGAAVFSFVLLKGKGADKIIRKGSSKIASGVDDIQKASSKTATKTIDISKKASTEAIKKSDKVWARNLRKQLKADNNLRMSLTSQPKLVNGQGTPFDKQSLMDYVQRLYKIDKKNSSAAAAEAFETVKKTLLSNQYNNFGTLCTRSPIQEYFIMLQRNHRPEFLNMPQLFSVGKTAKANVPEFVHYMKEFAKSNPSYKKIIDAELQKLKHVPLYKSNFFY